MGKEVSMKVAVRVRPKLRHESDFIDILHFFDDKPQMIAALDKPFTFDHVFQPDSSQDIVYDELISPLVYKFVEGFNCAIIAYGSTGTGKTYTMGTGATNNDQSGMIPRVLHYLFQMKLEQDEDDEIEISISFIEIYVGKIYDLLRSTGKSISAKHARESNGFVVTSLIQALGLLDRGTAARRTRSTNLNTGSSRSHAIFTIHFKRMSPSGIIRSQLNMVDLAGSEGIRRTGAEGTELKEGVNINRGLLALGRLVRDLSAKRPPAYRDDILTSVLKDSLNRKSYVCMLACISPCDTEAAITIDSLRFASHARGAQLKPEMIKAFRDYKAANPEKFLPVQSLINQVPPTPAVTKFWLPTQSYTAKLSLISETSEESTLISSSTSSFASNNTTIPETTNTYSPIVRKCIEGLESHLDAKLSGLVNSVLKNDRRESATQHESPMATLLPMATPAHKSIKNSEQWQDLCSEVRSIIRDELQTIMRSVKITKTPKAKRLSEKLRESPVMRAKHNEEENKTVRCRLTFADEEQENVDPVFKMPALPLPKGNNNTEDSVFAAPRRKSLRLSAKYQPEDTTDEEYISESFEPTPQNVNTSCRRSRIFYDNCMDDTFIEESPTPLRRSKRLSTSVLKGVENTPDCRVSITPAKSERISIIRKRFDKESSLMTPRSKKIRKNLMATVLQSAHRQNVIDILSKGTLKELMALPTIGAKTAQQIYTYRTLNGEFESYQQLENLPFWRGKTYERFLVANNLTDCSQD